MKERAETKREPGAPIISTGDVPEGIKAVVSEKLGADAYAAPAREDGGYKGPVIYANDHYLVQAVGKKQENAVVHRKSDVEFIGQKLAWREEHGLLNGVSVQVHYNGDQGKVYVWNQEREQAVRTERAEKAQAQQAPEKSASVRKAPKHTEAEKTKTATPKTQKLEKAPKSQKAIKIPEKEHAGPER